MGACEPVGKSNKMLEGTDLLWTSFSSRNELHATYGNGVKRLRPTKGLTKRKNKYVY